MQRLPLFLDPASDAAAAVRKLDTDLALVLESLERAGAGMDDASLIAPDHTAPTVSTAHSLPPRLMQLARLPPPTSSPMNATLPHPRYPPPTSHCPPGVYHLWGNYAARHGVWENQSGVRFGNTLVKCNPSVARALPCIAAIAPGESETSKSAWCDHPN